MEQFITKNSQKTIKIIPANFRNAHILKCETLKCLKDTDILSKIKDFKNIELSTLFGEIANLIINIDTSEGFNKAVMNCLSVCICEDTHALTEQYFNDCPELWDDYYEIITKCVEVNLRPFFKSLASELSTRLEITGNSLQSEQPTD